MDAAFCARVDFQGVWPLLDPVLLTRGFALAGVDHFSYSQLRPTQGRAPVSLPGRFCGRGG